MVDHEVLSKMLAKQKWVFAKSYAQKAPHEYFLKPDNPVLFAHLKKAIEEEGVIEYYYRVKVRYFYLGGYKYWGYELVMNRADEKNKYPSYPPKPKKEAKRLDDY